MLSGDGLLSCLNAPNLAQDRISEGPQQIAQYAELLDINRQIGRQVISDALETELYKPIFALSQEAIKVVKILNHDRIR